MDTYQAWRTGSIVPGRISLARQHRHFSHESLANVCGTDAEAVDLWEQGIEYPELEQFEDLVAVTRYSSGFFVKPVAGLGAMFLVPEGGDGHAAEVDGLQSSFTPLSVRITTRGWPRSSVVRAAYLSE